MKNPHGQGEGAGTTQRAADKPILAETPCPNASHCRLWSATDGGDYDSF